MDGLQRGRGRGGIVEEEDVLLPSGVEQNGEEGKEVKGEILWGEAKEEDEEEEAEEEE